jgi:hypothetical protein
MTEQQHFTYTIPTSPEEISLSKWITFEGLATTPDIDQLFLQNKMIELFCDVPMRHVNKLKQNEIDEILHHLNATLNAKPTLYTTFEFGGLKYGLIPSFDKDITAGELIDLDSYLQKKDFISLMSILYRPITFERNDSYLIEPYNGTHQLFKEAPFHYLTGVLAFFLTIYEKLSRHILAYTEKEMKRMNALASLHQINSPKSIPGMSS